MKIFHVHVFKNKKRKLRKVAKLPVFDIFEVFSNFRPETRVKKTQGTHLLDRLEILYRMVCDKQKFSLHFCFACILLINRNRLMKSLRKVEIAITVCLTHPLTLTLGIMICMRILSLKSNEVSIRVNELSIKVQI